MNIIDKIMRKHSRCFGCKILEKEMEVNMKMKNIVCPNCHTEILLNDCQVGLSNNDLSILCTWCGHEFKT